MAETRWVEPVVRMCAVITRHDRLRRCAIEHLRDAWGEVSMQSAPIAFEAGGYYASTMGKNLEKTLVAFTSICDPAGLADWKHSSNRWEQQLASDFPAPDVRPLNLDPGYVTQAKLVLATTKDRDHRIYLRDGMFAEITLTYVGKRWNAHRWTYPSYRCDEVAGFAMECRRQLREHLQSIRRFRSHRSE